MLLLIAHSGWAAAQPAASQPADSDSGTPTSQPVRIKWPNSDFRLNFSAGSAPGPLRWSSKQTDQILAPSIVWSAYASADDGGAIGRVRLVAFLRARRPDVRIGRYFSATTVRPRPLYEPPETIASDAVRDFLLAASWSKEEPTRRYVDIRRPEARERLAGIFVREARRSGADFLSLDNVVLEFGGNPEGTTREEWSDACFALLETTYAEARRVNLPVVVNAACDPRKTWDRAARLCDGLVFEMPFGRRIRPNADMVESELAAYRRALDAGKLVALVPMPDPKPTQPQRFEMDRLVAAGVMLIRNPGDAVFVSQSSYEPKSVDWLEWPVKFGRPVGPFERNGDIFKRKFELGELTVDFSKVSVTVRFKD